MTVTLPLIKDSFFSGLVTAFVRSITAISAIILLVTPDFLLITCQINEQGREGKLRRGMRLCNRSDYHNLRRGAYHEYTDEVLWSQQEDKAGELSAHSGPLR